MLKTITEFVGYIIVAEPTISFLSTIYLRHSDISCVIIIPGEETDSAHMLLTQTSPVDYEKLCHLDVMGLADTPEDEQVKCTNCEQLTRCEAGWYEAVQAKHSINDVILIPLELIRSNRDAVRKAREAHLIHKENTLSPLGINRLDEAH